MNRRAIAFLLIAMSAVLAALELAFASATAASDGAASSSAASVIPAGDDRRDPRPAEGGPHGDGVGALTVVSGGEPDLAIGKTAPASALPGSFITYTLTVTNNGPTTAVNLVMVDGLPAGANYVSGGTPYGYLIFWSIPALEGNGASVSRQLVVTASQTITNSYYTVAADGGYEATGSVPVVTVIGHPALWVDKSGPALVRQGEPITYTLVVTNAGTAPASGLVITDAVPAGATHLNGGTLSGGEVTWSAPGLDPGASLAVQFAVVAISTVVNDSYGAVADGGVVASPGGPVTTEVRPWLLHVPLFVSRYTADEPNDVCGDSRILAANFTYQFLAEDIFDWYVYEISAPSPLDLVFRLEDFAPIAGQMLVYRGPGCASLSLIGQNGDFATTKLIQLANQPSGRYYVLVVNDGPTNLSTPYRLRLTTGP